MSIPLRQAIVPVYLFLCLIAGGSPQGVLASLMLQLLGLALLGWAAFGDAPTAQTRSVRYLTMLMATVVAVVIVQLIPLPPAIWSNLPGRGPVVAGFVLLEQPLPWLPWSMAPAETLGSGLWMIPPFAVLAGITRLGAFRSRYVAAAIVIATLSGVALGAVQSSSGSGYLFPVVTRGQAAGFFANANYMGTLLLVALPFVAALVRRYAGGSRSSSRVGAGHWAIAAAAALLIVLGLLLNNSAAAILLAFPVAAISLLLLIGTRPGLGKWVIGGAVAFAAAALVALATMPALSNRSNALSVAAREQTYQTVFPLVVENLPFGSGIGSYPRIFPRAENSQTVEREIANHVHNDYLEIILETGIFGALLIIAFLGWWGLRAIAIWRSPAVGAFARAATVGSAAVLLHSLVDFPARTMAISAVLAACVALMAEPRPRPREEQSSHRNRPARHLSLD